MSKEYLKHYYAEKAIKKADELKKYLILFDISLEINGELKTTNQKNSIKLICMRCGYIWYSSIKLIKDNIRRNRKRTPNKEGIYCPQCGSKKVRTKEYVIKELIKKYPEYDFSKVNYIDIHTDIEIICHKKDKYGYEHGSFYRTPSYLLLKNSHSQCDHCSKSQMEKRVEQVLNLFKVKYKHSKDKRFGSLIPDYIIDEYKLIIEVMGEQHYPGTKMFTEIIGNRDYKKKSICESICYKLLYYDDITSNSSLYGIPIIKTEHELINILTLLFGFSPSDNVSFYDNKKSKEDDEEEMYLFYKQTRSVDKHGKIVMVSKSIPHLEYYFIKNKDKRHNFRKRLIKESGMMIIEVSENGKISEKQYYTQNEAPSVIYQYIQLADKGIFKKRIRKRCYYIREKQYKELLKYLSINNKL